MYVESKKFGMFQVNPYPKVIASMSLSWNFPARASPNYEGSEPSRAELGHINFRADTELTLPKICMSKNCKLAANFRSYLKIAPVTWF